MPKYVVSGVFATMVVKQGQTTSMLAKQLIEDAVSKKDAAEQFRGLGLIEIKDSQFVNAADATLMVVQELVEPKKRKPTKGKRRPVAKKKVAKKKAAPKKKAAKKKAAPRKKR